MLKRTQFSALGILCLIMSPCVLAENYTLDPQHSFVQWQVAHFGFSNFTGKMKATGTLEFDQQKPEASKVNATIKIADVVTAVPELDKHLQSKLFFDAAQFPTATFVSDKIEVKDNQITKVTGNLTLHGVTKAVTLDCKFNKKGKSLITDKETVGFSASGQIKRSDFGINELLPGLGDEVSLNIQVEANKT